MLGRRPWPRGGFTNDLQPEMGPQETEIRQNRTRTFGGFPEHCILVVLSPTALVLVVVLNPTPSMILVVLNPAASVLMVVLNPTSLGLFIS